MAKGGQPRAKSHRNEDSSGAGRTATEGGSDAGRVTADNVFDMTADDLYGAVCEHVKSLQGEAGSLAPRDSAPDFFRTTFVSHASQPDFGVASPGSCGVVGALLHELGVDVTGAAVVSVVEFVQQQAKPLASARSSGESGPDRVFSVFGASRRELYAAVRAEVERLTKLKLAAAPPRGQDKAYDAFRSALDLAVLDAFDDKAFERRVVFMLAALHFTNGSLTSSQADAVLANLVTYILDRKAKRPATFGDVLANACALAPRRHPFNAPQSDRVAGLLIQDAEMHRQAEAEAPAQLDGAVGSAVARAIGEGKLPIVHGPSGAGKTVGAASATLWLSADGRDAARPRYRDFWAVQVSLTGPDDAPPKRKRKKPASGSGSKRKAENYASGSKSKAEKDDVRTEWCIEKVTASLVAALGGDVVRQLGDASGGGGAAGLAESYVLVLVDEVGSRHKFLRHLCATHNAVAEHLRKNVLHVGRVALVAAGTGAAGATHQAGSRPATYESIRVGTRLWPQLEAALRANQRLMGTTVPKVLETLSTASAREPPGITTTRRMLENARAAVLFARCLSQHDAVISGHRPVAAIVALAQSAALQFKKLNGLQDVTDLRYVSLIFDAHAAARASVEADKARLEQYADLVSKYGVLDDLSCVLRGSDLQAVGADDDDPSVTRCTRIDGEPSDALWCRGARLDDDANPGAASQYLCWPASGRFALPSSQVALAQLAVGLVPHDATGEGFEQSVADYFHFVLRACWPVAGNPAPDQPPNRSEWFLASRQRALRRGGPTATLAPGEASTPARLERDIVSVVYKQLAASSVTLAELPRCAIHCRFELRVPFERGNELAAAAKANAAGWAAQSARGLGTEEGARVGSVVCVNAPKAAAWDVMVRVHPPGGQPHCWLVQVKRFTKDRKLSQVQLRAELGKMGHRDCLVEYCAYFVWATAASVPDAIAALASSWSERYRASATRGKHWRAELCRELSADPDKAARAAKLLLPHHALDNAAMCAGPVHYVLFVHAESWVEDGLVCPRDATVVRCAKDGLHPVPVDWSCAEDVVEVGTTSGKHDSLVAGY